MYLLMILFYSIVKNVKNVKINVKKHVNYGNSKNVQTKKDKIVYNVQIYIKFKH